MSVQYEKSPTGALFKERNKAIDPSNSFESGVFSARPEVGSRAEPVRMAIGSYPGGHNSNYNFHQEKPGNWKDPRHSGGDAERTFKKNYTWNLESIAASLVGNVIYASATREGVSAVLHNTAASLLPFFGPFLLGFSASRIDSAWHVLKNRGPSGIFGALFSGLSIASGVSTVGAVFTGGMSALVDLGCFAAGFLAGRILKKYT